MKILVTPTSLSSGKSNAALNALENFADEIVYNPYGRPLQPHELVPLMNGVDGMIAGLDYITEEVIGAAPTALKVISRYGAGYDRIDLKAAASRGILITNTPGVNSESVADLAFGLMISVARTIPTLDAKVKAGEWPRSTGFQVFGKTLGILGLGGIGKGVARRARGFSMEILAYDPFMDHCFAEENGIKVSTFEDIIDRSDIISLHLPLNEFTKHIINASVIDAMKQGAILINTARGGLIDEQAAYKALVSGKLGGLGLDAFEEEPPPILPFFSFQNVVITPHTGAHTVEAVHGMAMLAIQNLMDVLTGKSCPNIINPLPCR